jgi:hypothetical protein
MSAGEEGSLQAQPLLGDALEAGSGEEGLGNKFPIQHLSLRPDPLMDSPFFGLGSPTGKIKKSSWRRWCWGVVHVYASNHWHPMKHDYGRQTHYWPSKIFEIMVGFFIILNVITSIIDTAVWESSYNAKTYQTWDNFVFLSELISTIFFIFEYSIRVWACVEEPKYREKGLLWGRLAWALKPLALIDLLNVIVFAADLSMIYFIKTFKNANEMHQDSSSTDIVRIFRMFRIGAILRFERRVKGIHRIAYVLRDVYAELWMAMYLIAVVVLVSAATMYQLEHEVNAEDFPT